MRSARSPSRRRADWPRLTGEATLTGGEAQVVLRALARAESDAELAVPLLSWIERRQPTGLAPALDAALTHPADAPAIFVVARGLLGDGLPAEREEALLASTSAPQRAAAAGAAGPEQAGRLADLLRNDPAPEVRVAALKRLARLEGPASLDTLLDAFDDEDGAVRKEAAEHAAAFGPEVVPRLRDAATRWPWPASQTAVLALRTANSAESRGRARRARRSAPGPARAHDGCARARPRHRPQGLGRASSIGRGSSVQRPRRVGARSADSSAARKRSRGQGVAPSEARCGVGS